MALTSLTFLLFFAVCFALYWLARKRDLQNGVLVLFSYLFYATCDSRFGLLLLATSVIDFCIALGIARTHRVSLRRTLLALSIGFDLGILALFKYFDFFADNLRSLAGVLGWHLDPVILNLLLPVGVSFYTLKSLGYTIDVYRRHVEPTSNLLAYLTYVAFFPQLLAGPIDRADNLLPQLLKPRTFNYEMAVTGCRQILWGLFKKMVVADNLAPIVNLAYAQVATRPGPDLLFATICFALQIYCDFSAYSDIAIGGARVLGLESVVNFAHPYFSASPGEFWRRWHISLMSWFRDYVFFPLGGLRSSLPRRGFNVMLTFLLSGIWHGASWNFVLWGAINGVGVLPAAFQPGNRNDPSKGASKTWSSLLKASKIVLTFLFICMTWIFFRATDLSTAILILKKILTQVWMAGYYFSIQGLLHPYDGYPLAGKKLLVLLLGFFVIEIIQNYRLVDIDNWPRFAKLLAYNSILVLIFYFGAYTVNQFYYYQF
jgi:D-alanyl-lipoteichoic acid acyltransferase DltB (MBOAT superfamily)